MENISSPENAGNLKAASGRLAQRVLVICENRLQLLMVEVQEERERMLRAILLGIASAVFGLLAGITLTVLLAMIFWPYSPLLVLLGLTLIYAAAVAICVTKLRRLQKDWQTLPATIEQIKKDRDCLEKQFKRPGGSSAG